MTPLGIADVAAWQALDSRGKPTVACRVTLHDGSTGQARVPSGASTGRHEAVELRDGLAAWGGAGVTTAVANIRGEIRTSLLGRSAEDLAGIDESLRALDGTTSLSRLGANAILGASIAAARAVAASRRVPMWRLYTDDPVMPMPMVNIVSGGAHANRMVDIQDVLVIPVGASSFSEAIEWAARVRAATAVLASDAGLPSSLVADEGGIAGALPGNREAVELVVRGIEKAGLALGDQAAIALDIAATQFYDGEKYSWAAEARSFGGRELVDEIATWCKDFPIVSIEDVAAEDDWETWSYATSALPTCHLVGDDLFVTDLQRLEEGYERGVANSVLVKVNQSGTLSSALEVLRSAQAHGYSTVVSARSGETEDDWLADLAVGWRAGQIKVGSTTRSERNAKWNRLLELEHDDPGMPFAGWRSPLARPAHVAGE